MTNHPNRGRIEPQYIDEDWYKVECVDTGEIVSNAMPREKALARCRKFNSIPIGQPRSGNYRIVPVVA